MFVTFFSLSGGNCCDFFYPNFESSYLLNGLMDWLDFLYGNIIRPCLLGGVDNNQFWKCHSDTWPKCAQSHNIITCKRKRVLHNIIYSRATSLIYIVVNREKEEEEETPIHYYGKARDGTTVNDEVLRNFPFRYQVDLWLGIVCHMSNWHFQNWLISIPPSSTNV